MNRLLKQSLAALVSVSLLWDLSWAAAPAAAFSAPSSLVMHRLSAEALNARAVWQYWSPNFLTVRRSVAVGAVGFTAAAAGAYAAWGRFAQAAAQAVETVAPLRTIAGAERTIDTVRAVSLQHGDGAWSVAARELGSGGLMQKVLDLNPDAHWKLHDTVYVPLQVKVQEYLVSPDTTMTFKVYAHPLLHQMYTTLHNPVFWLVALSAVLLGGVALYVVRRLLKPSTRRLSTRPWWGGRAARRVFAGLQVALLLANGALSFGAARSFKNVVRGATDQVAQGVGLKQKAAVAAKEADGYKPPVTVGAQTYIERYDGGGALNDVGPNVTLPNVPIPHAHPMSGVDALAREQASTRDAAEKTKAVHDALDQLAAAAGAYAQAGAYVQALTERLDRVTDAGQRTELQDALDVAVNQKNAALNTLKEAAKLPDAILGVDEDVDVDGADRTLLADLRDALNKPDLLRSDADPQFVLARLDATLAAKKADALARLRWWHKLPTGFSASFTFNLIDAGFPLAWLSNTTLILPTYDTLDPVKDKAAIDSGIASLTTARDTAQTRIAEALTNLEEPKLVVAAPTSVESAKEDAARIERRWAALSDLGHFNVTPEQMTAWLSLSDADRKAKIAEHVDQRFTDVLPSYQSWLAVIQSRLPAASADPDAVAPDAVKVDPLTLGVAGSNGIVPAYNGQPQIEKGATSMTATYVRIPHNAKQVAALKTEINRLQGRLDKQPEESTLAHWQLSGALLDATVRLAEATRDPFVLNPGFQQSHHYSYAWLYTGIRPLVTKVTGTVVHLFRKPKPSNDLKLEIREAQETFVRNLGRTARQIKLDRAAADEALQFARQALDHQRQMAGDADGLAQAQSRVTAAEAASTKAQATYTVWERYAQASSDDPFHATFVRIWNATPAVLDNAAFAIQAAERHAELVKGNASIPTGFTWDANTFIGALPYDPAPGKAKDFLFTGVNGVTTYDPSVRPAARDKQSAEEQKADAAALAARQDATLSRAAVLPEVAARVAEADDLLVLGAAEADVAPTVSHQAMAHSREAAEAAIETARQAGVSVHDVPPLKHEDIRVVAVPDAAALAKALYDAQHAPEAGPQHVRWMRRVIQAFNIPVSATHFFQVLGPVKQVGTQATVGAWALPKNLFNANKTGKLNQKKKDAQNAADDLQAAMDQQELFYRVKGLVEILHGRTENGAVTVPGLVQLSAQQAAHTEQARLELQRAIDTHDAAKQFVLYHRYRKSLANTLALHAHIVTASQSLQALMLALPADAADAMKITLVSLPAVPTVTLPPLATPPAAELAAAPAPVETVVPPAPAETTSAPESLSNPTAEPPVVRRRAHRESATDRAARLTREAAEARVRAEAAARERAEAARRAEADRQAELRRQQDQANQVGRQPDPAAAPGMMWCDWLYEGGFLLGFIGLVVGFILRLRSGRGTVNAGVGMGIAVLGLTLPLIGGSALMSQAVVLGGLVLQGLQSFPISRTALDRRRPPSFPGERRSA